jgi:hypothetical protein
MAFTATRRLVEESANLRFGKSRDPSFVLFQDDRLRGSPSLSIDQVVSLSFSNNRTQFAPET